MGAWVAAFVWIGVVSGCKPSGSGGAIGGSSGMATKECTGLPPLAQKASYTVGFVPIYEPDNEWGVTNTSDMIREAENRGHKLSYTPLSKGDAAEQVARMQALIDAKVDVIMLRPMDASALAPSVVAARKACIPVFTENRFLDPTKAIPGTDYVTGIGADPVYQGELVAGWLIKSSGGNATIIELEGTAGSSSAIGRKKGFDTRIATQPGMRIVASQAADFERPKAHEVCKQLLSANPTATVVYTHGDVMALGALDAMKEVGKAPGKDMTVVSIDGLKEAVRHVIDGTIAAIAFNDPRFGAISFDTIEQYAKGQTIPPRVTVKGLIIDRTNAQWVYP